MASRVSEVQRVERRLHEAMSARPRDDVAYAEALNEAIALLRRGDPALEWFGLPDLLDELASTYCHLGRFDDAAADPRADRRQTLGDWSGGARSPFGAKLPVRAR